MSALWKSLTWRQGGEASLAWLAPWPSSTGGKPRWRSWEKICQKSFTLAKAWTFKFQLYSKSRQTQFCSSHSTSACERRQTLNLLWKVQNINQYMFIMFTKPVFNVPQSFLVELQRNFEGMAIPDENSKHKSCFRALLETRHKILLKISFQMICIQTFCKLPWPRPVFEKVLPPPPWWTSCHHKSNTSLIWLYMLATVTLINIGYQSHTSFIFIW